MKYVCIKDFIYDKINMFSSSGSHINHKFIIGDKAEIYDNVYNAYTSQKFRDEKIDFYIRKNGLFLYMYLPGRKFNKHFKSEGKLREDRINEILNG